MEHESDGDANCDWNTWHGHQMVDKRTGVFGNNHLNYSIVEIGQNTEKSPGGLKKLAVTQTPVRNLQLTLV